MKKIILVLSVLFSTQITMAQTQVSPLTKISSLITYSNSVLIRSTHTHTNKDNCSNSSSGSLIILPLTPTGKNLYSAILSAYVTGAQVKFIYSGCVAGLPNLVRVDMVK